MSEPITISWTRPMLKRFKRAYAESIKNHGRPDGIMEVVFTFEGHEFLVGYAKYLIEYLETKFGSDS